MMMQPKARNSYRRLLLGATLVLSGLLLSAQAGLADPIPTGWQASNMKPVGYSRLDGSAASKLSIKQVNGRWYLYAAGRGLHILDVTDATDPKYLKIIPAPKNTAVSQVTLHGHLLLTNLS
ncbi:MAG TPA: hypothetical protein VLZ03_15350, partial [Thermodesulfobacteriota bacterium]|nr:hypothetical protein [Thermodesulfobacteriota bacterium]